MSLSSSRTTIYNEVFDENSLPSEEEIREYAVKIGINPESEPHLLHLARDGLMQALPPDWKPCFDEELNAWYYFNFRSGESRWEHPLDDVYRMLVRKGRSESVSSAGDDDSKTSLKEDLKSYEEAVTSDMLSRNADPFKGSAGFRKASLQLAPLRKATTRSESSLLSAALAGPGGGGMGGIGASSSFGPASPSLSAAAVSSRANTMTRSDSAPAAVAVASPSAAASSPWLQLGAGGEQAEGFSVPVPVPAPSLQRIDIDKMDPAIASSSSSSRATGRQRLASAKEKHPRTMHGRSELTLSGGGSIFLKSNKAQTPDTPDTPLVSPAQPMPTIEVVSSMGPGDTLPKSILRGDPHARSSASKLLWDLDPREMSYEEKHMWRRQELEEERKSVRFNLDKDLDIRFNISDSEGENEENGEGEEVVGEELDKEEDWNTDDEDADGERFIAGVKVSDILNLMDASELDEPSPKELINLPMLSEDNPETQVERQGLADEADDLEICISSEKDMIDTKNGAEESTNHKQRSSETQEQISIDLQKAISGGDSLESEEAPKLDESSSALPLPVVEVTPPPPSPLPSPPADIVAQPQLPEVTSEPPSEELGKLTDSLKEEDEAEEEEVVAEIEDKNEANLSEEVKQEEVENIEASDQKSNLNASSKPSFPPLIGAHSASELIADLRKALDLADEGLQKSNQKGLKDSIEEEPKEEKIEQDDTKSLSQSTQKSEEKLQFVSEKQLIEPKQSQKQGQLKSNENEAENKEAELLVEQRHQKMYQLQVESQKMLRAFQEQLQMNTDTAIHRLEEQHARQLAQLQEQLLQAEDEEKSRLQLEVFSRLSCFRQDLQMQQEAQEASIRENMERSLAELRTTLAAERETQLEEQRTMLQAHLEEERTNLQAEANRQLEELRTEMSESNRLKLEEVRAVLEAEGEAHVAQMREEMVAKRAEVEEKHQQELAVLEDKAQEALTARLQSRLDELETTALSEAASQLEEKLEVQKQSVLEKHRSNLEQLNTQHAEACEKLREEYHKEEEILKKAYAERLEELRVHLELERQRLRNRDQQEEERERDKMLESSRVLEKLRCEKRLLEDKYRSLKEKYIRLKTDVKLSIERRKRRETGGTTTGSETERSTSHTRTSVGVSSMTRPPDTDRERILPSGA